MVESCNPTIDYNGSVGVIDGSSVLITPFKDAIIPPPMCGYKINTQASINKIIWSPTNLDLMLFLTNGDLDYYKYGSSNKK